MVGEFGANLSGGQRQRLSIARALLLDPPVLVLDDATAAVDPETEHEIRTAVQRASQGRTSLIVSNRISTLLQADRVLVLQQGRVVQYATPLELLRRPGTFRQLAELQYADQIDRILVDLGEGIVNMRPDTDPPLLAVPDHARHRVSSHRTIVRYAHEPRRGAAANGRWTSA